MYSWNYLRDALNWSFEETQEVLQNLINSFQKNEPLSLPEKAHLCSGMKILRKEGSFEYAFNLRDLAQFKEAVFHDTFITHSNYRNITGLFGELPLPKGIRGFPLKEDLGILDDALQNWEGAITDHTNQDPLIIRLRKDRKNLLKKMNRNRDEWIDGYIKWQYITKYLKLLTYDIFIFVESLFGEESTNPISLSSEFNTEVVISKESVAHIMLLHYYPDLDDYRSSKSIFDERNSPYELIFHLRVLFALVANIVAKPQNSVIEKIDYEYKGRVIRCRINQVPLNGTNYQRVATMHPLEIPQALEYFKNNRIDVDPIEGISKVLPFVKCE
jgi:hypothetical protein